MKPILYGEHEKEFNTNGIGILSDAIDCNVDTVMNGSYELELIYPVKGIHFGSIGQRGIVLAKPDPVTRQQPFRIYRITKPMNGKVTVYARHAAYDLAGIPAAPFTASSAATALQAVKDNAVTECPFTFWTDKATEAAMTAAVPSTIWSLLGGTQGSILDTYGGEYEFDRWEVKLHNRRGADRGVSIRYGKNLTSLEQDENIANCCTGIYPYWTNAEGTLVQLEEKTVSAEGTFSYTGIKTVDFSAEWAEAPTQEQLRARAEKYIRDNDIGKPAISWKVEFVALEQTEEYRGKEILEQILLGDTVTVVLPELNINVSARAVAARYKPLLDRYAYVTLGSVKANIADTIVQQGQDAQKKPSRDLMQIMSEQLTKILLGAKGGAVRLLDTDSDGMPDELYIADNADPALAKKVWRFNYEGWGASKTGYDGPYIMGASFDTGIVADFITAGILKGVEIIGEFGTIGGFTMSEHTLGAVFRKDYPTFTQEDLEKAIAYSVGSSTLTEEEIEKYDVNMNGDVDTADVSTMQGMIGGTTPTYSEGRIVMDATNPKETIVLEVTAGYRAGERLALGMGLAKATKFIASTFACGTDNGYTGTVTAGDKTLTIKGGIITGVS